MQSTTMINRLSLFTYTLFSIFNYICLCFTQDNKIVVADFLKKEINQQNVPSQLTTDSSHFDIKSADDRINFKYMHNDSTDYMYRFTWDFKNKNQFEGITSYRIIKKFHHKACNLDFQPENRHLYYSKDINYTDIQLEPYTKYQFTLEVNLYNGTSIYSKTEELSTDSDFENITDTEKPRIEQTEPDYSFIKIYFQNPKCQLMRGPLYLKYKASSVQNWCNNISLINKAITYSFKVNWITISYLKHYCTYNISIYFSRGDNDWSNPKFEISLINTTKSFAIATKVEHLQVISKTRNDIHLRWKLSSKPNGVLKEYRIIIEPNRYQYTASINQTVTPCILSKEYMCHPVNMYYAGSYEKFNISIIGINENDLSEADLNNITDYAKGKYEYKNSISVTAKESKPAKPANVKARWTDRGKLNVSWKHAVPTNGILKNFTIWTSIQYDNHKTYDDNFTHYLDYGESDYKFEYHKVLTNWSLQPLETECLDVYVTAHNNDFMSERAKVLILGPPIPRNYDANKVTVTDLGLHIPIPDNGTFFQKMLVFKANVSVAQDNAYLKELDKISYNIHMEEEHTRYIFNQLIHTYSREDKISEGYIRINKSKCLFQKNAKYRIAFFIVNQLNTHKEIKRWLKTVSTDMPILYGSILTVILAFSFVLPFLAYLVYRYRHKIRLHRHSFEGVFQRYSVSEDISPLAPTGHDYEEHTAYREEVMNVIPTSAVSTKPIHSKRVKIEIFGNYIKKSLENGELQQQHQLFPKWEELKMLDKRFTCNYGSLPENRSKNRYKKIIAYDHTRVKLNKLPEDEFSDYINANFINGYKLLKAYIATQGPTRYTLNDFWRMIWEQNVNNIVMIGNLNQNKRECEVYWPEENGRNDYNGIIVELVDIKRHSAYDVRDFKVQFNCSTRKISQVQFKAWPSARQPFYPQTLVPLLQKMLTLPYRQRSPILVHCSAGVGRTGTVILCDISLRMAAAEGAVDVLGALDRLRAQRPNMVDNIAQYKLSHLVILACLTDWNTSIPCDGSFQSAIEGRLEDGIVPLNLAYLKESEWQDDAMKIGTASTRMPMAPEKNRIPNIVPEEQYQICLEVLPDHDESSTYINAIVVNSFRFSDRYIITQQPLPNTLSDFWRMVIEQQCTVVINLNEIDFNDKTSIQFWPEDESKMNLQDGIGIQHVESKNLKEYLIITVRINYRPNDFEQTKLSVEIINFKDWQSHQAVPNILDDFVSFVEDSTVIGRKSHPVIVTCHDGVTGCGLFVATSNLIEQMKLDKSCDICKSVRTIRYRRKQFMDKEIQLEFLYRAAVFYLNNFGVYHELENY